VTGKVVWSEKWEHSCEALIDARRFRLANEALLGREKRGPRGEPQTRAMLKGAIKCPDCEGSSHEQAHVQGIEQARRRDLHLLSVHRQHGEQVRRLRAERDRLKALPSEPDRWDE
jgi:hypothetical protein